MHYSRWRNLLLAAVLVLPGALQPPTAAHAQAAPASATDLAWFHGAWNLAYEDAVLGPVRGRAVVSAGKQGLEIQVRLRDPRSDKFHVLKLAASDKARVEAGVLEFKLHGSSPPSGYSDPAELPAARVLAVPSGTQIQARLERVPPAYVVVRPADSPPPLADPYLSVRIPIPAGARETLAAQWGYWIHRARDMASNRAGSVTERDGRRLAQGAEIWTRPSAIVTAVTDLDLPAPARLAAMHKDRQLAGGKSAPTPQREALEAKWGPGTYAVAWLRLSGVDLPVQPKRALRVAFEDPNVVWTGEARSSQANPESLDIRVQVLKGATAGPKWFALNGSAAVWDHGVEPVAIRHLRSLSQDQVEPAGETDKPRFESTSELFLGEVLFVEVEYASEPSFETRGFASRVGKSAPVRYEITKVAGQKAVFRSGPILLDADAPVDTAAGEGLAPSRSVAATISASAGSVLRSEEPESTAPSLGRTVGLVRILETPASLWNRAMQSAAKCRRAGKSVDEISRRIVTAGFEKRSLAVSLEDHAAALLLRDELAAELGRYADAERKALASGRMRAAYTAQLIAEVQAFRRPPITEIEVRTPDNQELIALFSALSGDMLSRWFKGNNEAFLAYATEQVAAARRALVYRAWSTSQVVSGIDDCDVERILATVRAGLGPVVENVQRKLLRRPRAGEPSVPRWVPDRIARSHVGSLGVLAEGIKALTEYSSIDTDVAIAAATVATLGGGGFAGIGGKLATYLGGATAGNALGQIAAGAALTAAALDIVDLGLLASDFAQYGEALAEVRLAEGLVGIAGDARLKQARDDA